MKAMGTMAQRPSVRPASTFSFKLDRKHALGMGIQICSNKGTGPFRGPIMGKIRKILINLQKSSSHEPPVGMHWYLAWDILGARRFKFVQIKSLGVIHDHALKRDKFLYRFIFIIFFHESLV